MGVIIPNGYLLASQEFLLAGAPHPLIVTSGHDWDGSGYTADGAATKIRTAWDDAWWDAAVRGNNWSLGRCRILGRTIGGSLVVGEDPTITPGAAGSPTESPPVNSAFLVRKLTGFAGRAFRGRMFVPLFGLVEAGVDSAGVLTPATQTAIQAYCTDWQNQVNTDLLTHVLLHDSAVPPTEVTALSLQPRLATQRRRMRS